MFQICFLVNHSQSSNYQKLFKTLIRNIATLTPTQHTVGGALVTPCISSSAAPALRGRRRGDD